MCVCVCVDCVLCVQYDLVMKKQRSNKGEMIMNQSHTMAKMVVGTFGNKSVSENENHPFLRDDKHANYQKGTWGWDERVLMIAPGMTGNTLRDEYSKVSCLWYSAHLLCCNIQCSIMIQDGFQY